MVRNGLFELTGGTRSEIVAALNKCWRQHHAVKYCTADLRLTVIVGVAFVANGPVMQAHGMVNQYRWLRGAPLINLDCFQVKRCEPAPALTLRGKCQVLLGSYGNPVTLPETMKKAPFLGL